MAAENKDLADGARKLEENKSRLTDRANDLTRLIAYVNSLIEQNEVYKAILAKKQGEETKQFSESAIALEQELRKNITSLQTMQDKIQAAVREPPKGDPALEKSADSLLDETMKPARETFEAVSKVEEFFRILTSRGYTKEVSATVASASVGEVKESKEEPVVLGGIDWITEENIRKVREQLKKLKNMDPVNKGLEIILNKFEEQLGIFRSKGSEKRDAAKQYLNYVIQHPGWGVVSNAKDQYLAISQEEYLQKITQAQRIIDEADLIGTEEITNRFLAAYALRLAAMRRDNPVGPDGQRIRLNASNLPPFPPIIIRGPAGTGKTTIVQALSRAFDMESAFKSMAGINEAYKVLGRGPEWGSPEPSMVAEAQHKLKRKQLMIVFDEAEKVGPDVHNAYTQLFERSQPTMDDTYFGAEIDKRDIWCVATCNNFAAFPEHIRSRLEPVDHPGYSDAEKVLILKKMAIGAIGVLHKKVKLISSDPTDLTGGPARDGVKARKPPMLRYQENEQERSVPFEGFHPQDGLDPRDDAIQFIVDAYITEPGVREAKAMLDTVVQKANSNLINLELKWVAEGNKPPSPIVTITKDLIISALGPPRQNARHKQLNREIVEESRKFDAINKRIVEILAFNKENRKAKPSEVKELKAQIKAIQEQRGVLAKKRLEIIKELQAMMTPDRPESMRAQLATQIEEQRKSLQSEERSTIGMISSMRLAILLAKDAKAISESASDRNELLQHIKLYFSSPNRNPEHFARCQEYLGQLRALGISRDIVDALDQDLAQKQKMSQLLEKVSVAGLTPEDNKELSELLAWLLKKAQATAGTATPTSGMELTGYRDQIDVLLQRLKPPVTGADPAQQRAFDEFQKQFIALFPPERDKKPGEKGVQGRGGDTKELGREPARLPKAIVPASDASDEPASEPASSRTSRTKGIIGTMTGAGAFARHQELYDLRAAKVGKKRAKKTFTTHPLDTEAGMSVLQQKMQKSFTKKSTMADNLEIKDDSLRNEFEARQAQRGAQKKPITFTEWKQNREIKQTVFKDVKIAGRSNTEYDIQIKEKPGAPFETKAYVKLLSEQESQAASRREHKLPTGRKIELGFTSAQPGDKEIELLLENAKAISQQTSRNEIHFENCEGCPERLQRIIDLAEKMGLVVTYDKVSASALKEWQATQPPVPASGPDSP